MLLGIFLKKGAKHIGNITIHKIDWRKRNATIGIIIAEKNSRGKGFAPESITLLADHAFNKLNLRKLYAGTIAANKASQRAFEKIGFKLEGVFREHSYVDGKYLDTNIMGLLRDEFNK